MADYAIGHDLNEVTALVTEDPVTPYDITYVARRNAAPELDGSWRWQLFTSGGTSPVGYLQSHRCSGASPDDQLRLVVLGPDNRALFSPGPDDREDHACVSSYLNALIWLHFSK